MTERGDMQTQMASIREKLTGGPSEPETPSTDEKDEGTPQAREGNTEGEATPEREESGESESEIRTLAQLAEAIDADPEFIYGLEMALSDGSKPVKLGEIKDKLQDLERRSGEIEKTRQQLETERLSTINMVQALAQYRVQADGAAEQARLEMRMAEVDFGRIDWDELKRLDPGRAALEQQSLMARYGAAKERMEQAGQAARQIETQGYAQVKAFHDNQLLEHVPEWRDQKKAAEDVQGIVDWAHKKYNFQDSELIQAVDWRHRDILRKAFMWDRLQEQSATAAGKAPKGLAGGRTLRSGSVQKAKVKELVSKARQTRSKTDQVSAAKAILDNAFRKR